MHSATHRLAGPARFREDTERLAEAERRRRFLARLAERTSPEVAEQCRLMVEEFDPLQAVEEFKCPEEDERRVGEIISEVAEMLRRGVLTRGTVGRFARRLGLGLRLGRAPLGEDFVRLEQGLVRILRAAGLSQRDACDRAARLVRLYDLAPPWEVREVGRYEYSANAIKKRARVSR
jgi:hypothetical protein